MGSETKKPSSDSEGEYSLGFDDFAVTRLPLYNSPNVTVRIGSTGCEYIFPKALLCEKSLYFAAAFQGNFKEGKDQSMTLEEIDGVVTTRSLQMLSQWVFLGRVKFPELELEESIGAAIEFARLADMLCIGGIDTQMAKHIQGVILDITERCCWRRINADECEIGLTSQHLFAAEYLPAENQVSRALAAAALEGYIDGKWVKEAEELENFNENIQILIRCTLIDILKSSSIHVKNPLSKDVDNAFTPKGTGVRKAWFTANCDDDD